MSERSLFNVRYTFPGYTFLLVTILMCFEQIIINYTVTKYDFLTVLFSFLFLLSGAPIGYFVSQIWYLYFHHYKKGYFYRDRKKTSKKKYMEYLCDIIDDDFKVVDDPDKGAVILDYLFNMSKDRDKLRSYITRRWDLYHIMGSTEISILTGIISGFLLKIYLSYDEFININNIPNFIQFTINLFSVKFFEIFYLKDILVLMGCLLLFFGFQNGKKRISFEHENMVDILVRKICKNEILELKRKLGNRSNEFFVNKET